MDPDLNAFPTFFIILVVVVVLFIVMVSAFIVTSAVRSRRVLRESGLDPLAAQAQIAVRLAHGPLGTPTKSLEARLTELEDLHRRGLISEVEHDAARTAALEQR